MFPGSPFTYVWWSRRERLENLRSDVLVGLKTPPELHYHIPPYHASLQMGRGRVNDWRTRERIPSWAVGRSTFLSAHSHSGHLLGVRSHPLAHQCTAVGTSHFGDPSERIWNLFLSNSGGDWEPSR
jgi:hypothetical protein